MNDWRLKFVSIFVTYNLLFQLIDLAEKFTADEIIPNAPHHDKTGEYPWAVIRKAHEVCRTN